MPKTKPTGNCHICGKFGELSEEHVPPKAAFNSGRFIQGRFPDDSPFGVAEMMIDTKIVQGGIRMQTLCSECNNNTGSWYAADFSLWCHWGNSILEKSGGRPSLVYCSRIHPLRVIKQIVTTFFSVVEPNFRNKAEELVRFVLNKEERGLSREYRFFAYYNERSKRNSLRYVPPVAILDTNKGTSSLFSEITFPPYGYVMTLNGSSPPDERLTEISHFANYGYYQEIDIQLPLPVLPTSFTTPGDYRSFG